MASERLVSPLTSVAGPVFDLVTRRVSSLGFYIKASEPNEYLNFLFALTTGHFQDLISPTLVAYTGFVTLTRWSEPESVWLQRHLVD